MRKFVSRPVGYLIVGSLAMIIGLSMGVGVGYFFGGTKTANEVAVEAPQAESDDKVVSLPAAKTIVKPLPIPVPLEVPGLAPKLEEETWTAIPGSNEEAEISSAAPAPWPELAQKIEADRVRKNNEDKRQKILREIEQVQENLRRDYPERDVDALAEVEDIWPTPEELPIGVEAGDQPEQLARKPVEPNTDDVSTLEKPGSRIDRESEVWEANAVTVPDPAGKPMISIVIDDLGLNRRNTVRTIRLPGPLTLAFLTYAEDLDRQTSSAHAAGHELMVHFPMEPKNPDTDPGPNALREELSEKEIRRRLTWGLSRFKGYVGINNHMGSAFTGYAKGMAVVMDEVSKRGVLFLDSMTTQRSTGRMTAGQAGVPFVARDVFLDNEIDARNIGLRLAEVEKVARAQGHAIAIGHPHGATIEALASWLPHLEKAGFVLVPVSMIIKHRRGS
ncbi:MAG: divergent polysaccharide deacetylase family protein [Alphaproteobacteria bacterium]|mgnify:FL=1|jgi:polysaccharide deacetylase 2 family uncharacterized protein YibQ|nr:divergent polysaccharide deacetylase family protein [Alphaproteobacteria bacterium]MBT4085741.1 divergent polysaccharide deacetylase family protein [Alphaproteobacteria bacterium]MBT4543320.1 divergent polysaccharide deacetylase family protein [Alphaproteobacteria bacterium]MBT7747191.1 divergent polysaccharide deacetylase family protein [Alphaproteobacteria bacterium]